MKRTLLFITSLVLIVGCSKEPINENSLVDRNDVKYQQDSQKPYSGEIFDLYDNGNKKIEGSYKDGLLDGLWTVWYEDGQKFQEQSFKNGIPDGLSTKWNENGQKASEGTYKNGKLDGLWTSWYENGKKKYEGTYKDGKKDGLNTVWYSDGKNAREATYKDGVLDGLYTYWFFDGSKYKGKMERKQLDEDGTFFDWYDKEKTIIKSHRTFKHPDYDSNDSNDSKGFLGYNLAYENGLSTSWYRNGQKKVEGTYKMGKGGGTREDGLWTVWYENGQKKIEGTYNSNLEYCGGINPYRDSKKTLIEEHETFANCMGDGIFTYWHENGQKSYEVTYKDGKKDGLVTKWHENGQKYFEETYKDGKKDGLVTKWHENGQKYFEETYTDGKTDGLVTYWAIDGSKYEGEPGNGRVEFVWAKMPAGTFFLWYDEEKTKIKSHRTHKPMSLIQWKAEPDVEEEQGLSTYWHENGQKKSVKTFKDGKKDGLSTYWHENGQKLYEEIYKDGKLDGLHTFWVENGKKKKEVTYKDGKKDGLSTLWYKNGQKSQEETYKYGEKISRKCFDFDGNEKDCY